MNWRADVDDDVMYWEIPEGEPSWLNFWGRAWVEPLDFREGLIELVEGNFFNEGHLAGDDYGALISRQFADLNGLSIGSTFTVDNILLNNHDPGDNSIWDLPAEERYVEENIFAQESYEFEVIGLFEAVEVPSGSNVEYWQEEFRLMDIANRIYVPNVIAERAWRFIADKSIEMFEENNLAEVLGVDTINEEPLQIMSMFVLEDPLMLDDFKTEVEAMLPDFWKVIALTNSFADISTSMENLQQIADGILWISIGAALVVLSLLITLFLHDRKHEMGVYLAIGEKKSRIILQIVLEIITTAVIGITFAIFVGNFASESMSRSMLRSDLAAQADSLPTPGFSSNSLELMGFTEELTVDQMMEAYDVSLNIGTILLI